MQGRRPDYLLVFPWHFRDGIVEREEEYLGEADASSSRCRRSRSSAPDGP